MLTAHRDDGEIVLADDLDPARDRGREYRCLECADLAIPKLGTEVVYHFAHVPREGRICCAAGESREHMRAKLILYRLLASYGYDVALEATHRFHRRMDLRVASASRWCAIEIQTSRIEVAEMRRRIASDRRAGAYDTLWVWWARWRPPDDPDDLKPADLVQLPDDVRYAWHRTWNAQAMLRFGTPWLAAFTRAHDPDTGTRYRRTFGVEYFPASGRLVVARDRYGRPSVRFAARDAFEVVPTFETVDDTWDVSHTTAPAEPSSPRGRCDDIAHATAVECAARGLGAVETDDLALEQIQQWNEAVDHDDLRARR
jgi:hypothetical protein